MKDYVKNLVGRLFGWTVLVVVIVYFFQVSYRGVLGLYAAGIVTIPVISYGKMRRRQAERNFYDMTGYMEQFLCCYGREKTILNSLENCIVLYSANSPMRKVLKDAVHKLRSGEGNEEMSIVSMAFHSIHTIYPSERLKLFHTFIEKISRMGGEYRESMEILLRDLQLWKQRVVLHQKRRETIRQEGTLNIFLAVLLCYLSRMVMPDFIKESMVSTVWYQGSIVVTGILLLIGEAYFCWYVSGSWFDESHRTIEKKRRQQKRNYDYVLRHSSGIRYYLAKRVCRREIEKEFPYWILTVTLYLQEDSVYQSIVHSLGEQNYFLEQEIKQLLTRIYENPDDIQSYCKFCEFADIPELQTIMKLLYAVNTNGLQDTKRQILFLVEQNSSVINQTEETWLAHRLSALEFLKQFPMVIGGMKVVFDLFLFLLISMRDIQDFM